MCLKFCTVVLSAIYRSTVHMCKVRETCNVQLCDSNLQYVSSIDLVKPQNQRSGIFQTIRFCAACESAKSTCSKRDFWSVKNLWPKSVGKYVKKKWKNLNLNYLLEKEKLTLIVALYCSRVLRISLRCWDCTVQRKTSREFSFLRERNCLSLYYIFNHYSKHCTGLKPRQGDLRGKDKCHVIVYTCK